MVTLEIKAIEGQWKRKQAVFGVVVEDFIHVSAIKLQKNGMRKGRLTRQGDQAVCELPKGTQGLLCSLLYS